MKDNVFAGLPELGWDSFFAGQYRSLHLAGSVPARVGSVLKNTFRIFTYRGELTAVIPGNYHHEAVENSLFPSVGDWVTVGLEPGSDQALIRSVLPRKSVFTRQAPGGRQRLSGGKIQEQVVAANVDTVFIVSGLDGGRNLNLRRIERYLVLAWGSGALPVVILNKADLAPDISSIIEEVEHVAVGVAVHAVSALENTGLDLVRDYLKAGTTAAFLGSSGVGKSAIINALIGEERQDTGAIRGSDKEGRHTTTRRELILLPGGGMVIDTPGMREIQVWGDQDNLDDAFADIAELALDCRFVDCRHDAEPGCAVKEAVESGLLDESRFESYLKLQREMQRLAARYDDKARAEDKQKKRQFGKMVREVKKFDKRK